MRYGIFSDVHSNLEALEEVIKALKNEDIGAILCAGDAVGYAADPLGCVNRLEEFSDVCVAGNHDWAALDLYSLEYFNSPASQAILWTRPRLDEHAKAYLRSLELVYRNRDLTLVHSTLSNPEQFDYLTDTDLARQSFQLLNTNLCFIGHTHVPCVFMQDGSGNLYYEDDPLIRIKPGMKYIVNVGSVGQPRDNDPRAAYCIYDTEKKFVQLKRVKYNAQGAMRKILDSGLPHFLGERLLTGN